MVGKADGDHTGGTFVLVDERLVANRANWDERTAVHLASRFYAVDGWLRSNAGPRPEELEAIGDVSGRSLLHLQCHFGLDTLAFARAGATVTGLDFSSSAIDAARDLADRAGLADRATFVCADVLRAVEALDHASFDVVYVSVGSLLWLPSVERWAGQAAALVAPGGTLFVHDEHPFATAGASEGPCLRYGYFEDADARVADVDASYTDGDPEFSNRRIHQWNHGLGETVSAVIGTGLRLDSLTEHDWTEFARFPWLVESGAGRWTTPRGMPRAPLSFTLVARRLL